MYGKLLLLAFAFATTAEAQPAPLTLACRGTTTTYGTSGAFDPQPISMGIIVNLSDRTVQGFDYPFDSGLKITDVGDVEVKRL